MSRKDKKRKAENLLFLLLGSAFGIVGNFFVSSVIEFCNALITSLSVNLKITFWLAFLVAMAYSLIWIFERFSIILAKLGTEVLSKYDIKVSRRIRQYCIVSIIVSIVLFILQWLIE